MERVKDFLKNAFQFLGSYKALAILWLLVGLMVLIAGDISRLNYFCVWIILMLEMVENVIEENEKNQKRK